MRLWKIIAAQVPQDKVILDIGAFMGECALAAREVNQGAKIFAFEPNPHSIQTLRPTCTAKSISLVEAAVAEKDGTLSFVCSAAQSRIALFEMDQLNQVDINETDDVPICDAIVRHLRGKPGYERSLRE